MASIVIRTITQDEPSLKHIANGRAETIREYGPSYTAVLKFMYNHYKGREPQEKYLGIGQENEPAWNAEVIEKFQAIASSAHSMFFVAYVSVREEYGGRSIGRQMVQYCLDEFATKQGKHQYAYAVCSSKFSQRIFEKLGFQQVSELRFVDVEVDGEHVIQEHLVTEPHTHSKGYVKKIESVIGC